MKLSTLVAAAALAFAAPVFAAPIATFSSDVNGIFTDDFSFAPGVFSGNLSFSVTSLSGSVTFFSALLNGTGYDLGGVAGQDASFTATVSATQPFELTLLGYSGDLNTFTDSAGRYSLAISAAVPEPETWALMLAGLLAVGAAAHARRPSRPTRL